MGALFDFGARSPNLIEKGGVSEKSPSMGESVAEFPQDMARDSSAEFPESRKTQPRVPTTSAGMRSQADVFSQVAAFISSGGAPGFPSLFMAIRRGAVGSLPAI
jgi:hypothetical protein